MNKILCKIFFVLEIISLIGAYLVYYFTESKMGMSRYVSHKNYYLQDNYPMDLIKWLSIICVLLFTILVVYLLIKLKKNIKYLPKVIITLIISMAFLGYTILNSVDTTKSYYFVSVLIFMMCILQIFRMLLEIYNKKSKGVRS